MVDEAKPITAVTRIAMAVKLFWVPQILRGHLSCFYRLLALFTIDHGAAPTVARTLDCVGRSLRKGINTWKARKAEITIGITFEFFPRDPLKEIRMQLITSVLVLAATAQAHCMFPGRPL